jgi:hypothetical protein
MGQMNTVQKNNRTSLGSNKSKNWIREIKKMKVIRLTGTETVKIKHLIRVRMNLALRSNKLRMSSVLENKKTIKTNSVLKNKKTIKMSSVLKRNKVMKMNSDFNKNNKRVTSVLNKRNKKMTLALTKKHKMMGSHSTHLSKLL